MLQYPKFYIIVIFLTLMRFHTIANLLSRITGEEKYFLDNGFPLITTRMENVLYTHPEDYYMFSPEYQVITQLRMEGNIYITIENISEISFRFYGEKYPRSYYYKVNTELSGVVRCENSKNCKEMEDCDIAIIPHDNPQDLSDKTIFLSWKMKNGYITILWQYMNKLIKCEDFNALNVIKLILEGKQQQGFNSKIYNFARYLTKPISNETIVLGSTTLRTLAVQVSHCLECYITLILNCNNYSAAAMSSQLPDVSFGDVIVKSWNELFIKKPNNSETCNLMISTAFSDGGNIHQFWAFAAIYITDYIPPTTTVTTSVGTTDATTFVTSETINNATITRTRISRPTSTSEIKQKYDNVNIRSDDKLKLEVEGEGVKTVDITTSILIILHILNISMIIMTGIILYKKLNQFLVKQFHHYQQIPSRA